MTQAVKLLALGTSLSVLVAAQDVKGLLRDTARAMGAENLTSVEYSGSGFFYWFGQAASPRSPWPKFYAKSYHRIIDLSAGVSAQTVVRTQYENPPHGGGNQPVIGEETLTQIVSTHDRWSRDDGIGYSAGQQLEIWISPVGFLKAAMDHNATVAVRKISGKTYSVVSYKPENEYPVTGYINDRGMLEKVETRVDNALLGDMPIEASYTEYRSFGALKFPAKIVEKQGGLPLLELTITDAKRDVAVNIQLPPAQNNNLNHVGIEQPAPGVYFLTGTHNSVAVGFDNYVVVIEAPLNEARSKAVIAEVNRLFPNLPIRFLVNTHQHIDHAGGLRTYAARGATIITGQINKAYYENVFRLRHTLHLDELSISGRKVSIEGVTGHRTLSDGKHTVELYSLQNGGHADEMLIAYLPREKIVIEADEFTAGAASVATPPVANPFAAALVDNLDRLKLDYEIILGLHGRQAAKMELLKAAGRLN
jgi:glyoxylase-like metal-dependent hydrolase (beta-lactamase superfamily II)